MKRQRRWRGVAGEIGRGVVGGPDHDLMLVKKL